MTQIKIDKGIPVPDKKRGYGRDPKYPFRTMQVGDSFSIDEDPNTVRTAASSFSKRHGCGVKFTTRSENGGTRVWRIA